MILFWLGAALLAVILLLPFLFRQQRSPQTQISQLELNQQVFTQRQAELQRQCQQGEISEQDFAQLQAELQANLLDDTAVDTTPALQQEPTVQLWLIVAVVMAMAIGLYGVMGNYKKVAYWDSAIAEVPHLSAKLQSEPEKLTPAELERFALGLRTRLMEDESDSMGWLLYGRLQMSFGRPDEGTEAFEKALRLAPDSRAVNLSYAKALAASGDASKVSFAKGIYQRLLDGNSQDLEALSQQGFLLFESGDKAGAFTSWQRMLAILPKDSPRYQQIERTLQVLKGQGAPSVLAPVPQSEPTPASTPAATSAAPASAEPITAAQPTAVAIPQSEVAISQGEAVAAEPSTELRVEVTVSLAPESQLPKDGFLVVFARAVNGPPMPMAVKRQPLTALPVIVSLAESDSMMDNYRFGAVEPFEIVAKVVNGQDVATATTLLQGVSVPLTKAQLPRALDLTLSSQ